MRENIITFNRARIQHYSQDMRAILHLLRHNVFGAIIFPIGRRTGCEGVNSSVYKSYYVVLLIGY